MDVHNKWKYHDQSDIYHGIFNHQSLFASACHWTLLLFSFYFICTWPAGARIAHFGIKSVIINGWTCWNSKSDEYPSNWMKIGWIYFEIREVSKIQTRQVNPLLLFEIGFQVSLSLRCKLLKSFHRDWSSFHSLSCLKDYYFFCWSVSALALLLVTTSQFALSVSHLSLLFITSQVIVIEILSSHRLDTLTVSKKQPNCL